MPKPSEKLMLAVVPFLGALLLRFIAWSVRIIEVDRPKLDETERGIYTFWHGRMLIMPFVRPPGTFSVIISRHRDGELISRTMDWLGIKSSRGSSTRGGASALKDIIRLARDGFNIAITPDGPKGPRHVVQIGSVLAAKATGLPVYPVTYSTRKKKLLKPGTVL